MGRWRRSLLLAVSMALLTGAAVPIATSTASPAPSEPCVAGTVWEDLSSGVKYICIYDEIYGGTRWEPLAAAQTERDAFTARSSTYGCTFDAAVLSGASGGGGGNLLRSYRWPCASPADRLYQPAGELRIRTMLQRYASTWTTCRDTGYLYSTVTAWTLVGGLDMGASPDCGPGLYRTWGFGQVYQGGAWRGSALVTPSLWLD